MNYFKDKNNQIFAYTDEDVANGYGADLTAITKTEKDELLAPTAEQAKAQTMARLAEIDKEAVRPTRAIKVAELQGLEPSQDNIDKLIALEAEAEGLRDTL